MQSSDLGLAALCQRSWFNPGPDLVMDQDIKWTPNRQDELRKIVDFSLSKAYKH
jgi:hypothetical protein